MKKEIDVTTKQDVTIAWIKRNLKYCIYNKRTGETIAIVQVKEKNRQYGYKLSPQRSSMEFNPIYVSSETTTIWLAKDEWDLTSDMEVALANLEKCNR